MKKIFCIVLMLMWCLNSYAQNPDIKRTWHWYFGAGAGLDFSSGFPVADTTGKLHTKEGCAAISDINGNLLFYTDGDTIWDRTHNPMPNGINLTGCPILGSSAQACIIIPQPGHDSLYYIFTVDCAENAGMLGLRYSIVNMNLNGGMGDVMPSNKNILLYAPSTEGLTATYNCDKTGIWIMSHEYNTNNYVCYFLDINGINSTPVISSIGEVYSYYQAYMRFSPDGNLFASAYSSLSGVKNSVMRFDKQNGILYDIIDLIDNSGEYGTCFSNDNTKLYFTSGGNYIYQFDLNANDIPHSRIQIYDSSWSNSSFGALQNGIDGNIYVSSIGYSSISVITNPNDIVTMSNINYLSINLNNKISEYGITDFIQNYFQTSPLKSCIDTEKDTITTNLVIPNIFTPNNDGINDIFTINIKGYIEIHWKIYNRWGNELKSGDLNIENKNVVDLWDGRNKTGEIVKDGIYYYLIHIIKKNGEIEIKKGCIHLLK